VVLAVPAALAAVGASIVILRLGLVHADLAGALGPDWADRIPSQRRTRMVGRWWRGRLPTTRERRAATGRSCTQRSRAAQGRALSLPKAS
jgi:hypothetical protein